MHLNSELLFKKFFSDYFKPGMKILEIGPSGIPSIYNKIVNDSSIQWDTLDFENTVYIDANTQNLTYTITDPYFFPVEDNMYDIVLSGQVMEHVQEIWRWMIEIKRITKPRGFIFTIIPFSWPYHKAPIDCWRILPSGMEAIAKYCELDVVIGHFGSEEKKQLMLSDKQVITVPGRSYNIKYSKTKLSILFKWNLFLRFFRRFGRLFIVPIEVSYDTISILRKP